jgi:hypothetical protein
MFKAVCGAKAVLMLASGISGANSTPTASLAPFSFAPCRKEGNKLLGVRQQTSLWRSCFH